MNQLAPRPYGVGIAELSLRGTGTGRTQGAANIAATPQPIAPPPNTMPARANAQLADELLTMIAETKDGLIKARHALIATDPRDPQLVANAGTVASHFNQLATLIERLNDLTP